MIRTASLLVVPLWIVAVLVAETSGHGWPQEANADTKAVVTRLHSRQGKQQCNANDLDVSTECLTTFIQAVGGISLPTTTTVVCNDDCGGRIYDFLINTCGDTDTADVLANACSQNGDGFCFDVVNSLIAQGIRDDLSVACGTAGSCSPSCRDTLEDVLDDVGCCTGTRTDTGTVVADELQPFLQACSLSAPSPCPNPFSAATVAATSNMLALVLVLAAGYLLM